MNSFVKDVANIFRNIPADAEGAPIVVREPEAGGFTDIMPEAMDIYADLELEPEKIFEEYFDGKTFNERIELYDRVIENENLFLGKHWEGIDAPSFDKPVFNIVKNVVTYLIAMVVADDFATSIEPFIPSPENRQQVKFLEEEITKVFEQTHFRSKNRDFLRKVAINGDAYFHLRFDNSINTGQTSKGRVTIDIADNIDVIFGNPHDDDIQKQPYILVLERRNKRSLANDLRNEGLEFDKDELVADDDNPTNDDKKSGDDIVTVVHKYFRLGETIHYTRVTSRLVLTPPVDLLYKRYPIASMIWEKEMNNYHGWGVVDGLADNQYAINKLMAAFLESTKRNAIPITLYDETAIDGQSFEGGIGGYVPVRGNVNDVKDAVGTLKGGDVSGQVMQLVDTFSTMTKDLMGASDAALGTVNPDNASAIIAAQRATAAPLDLQIQSYHQTIEEVVRGIADIITTDYGLRQVWYEDEQTGQGAITLIDYSQIGELVDSVNVDIGAGAYFSEILQLQTLDNLVDRQLIANPVDYLEAIPSDLLKDKQKLVNSMKQTQQQAMQAQQMPQVAQSPQITPEQAAMMAGQGMPVM